jgi:hypothetical protein
MKKDLRTVSASTLLNWLRLMGKDVSLYFYVIHLLGWIFGSVLMFGWLPWWCEDNCSTRIWVSLHESLATTDFVVQAGVSHMFRKCSEDVRVFRLIYARHQVLGRKRFMVRGREAECQFVKHFAAAVSTLFFVFIYFVSESTLLYVLVKSRQ